MGWRLEEFRRGVNRAYYGLGDPQMVALGENLGRTLRKYTPDFMHKPIAKGLKRYLERKGDRI